LSEMTLARAQLQNRKSCQRLLSRSPRLRHVAPIAPTVHAVGGAGRAIAARRRTRAIDRAVDDTGFEFRFQPVVPFRASEP
jgi:hypothetical protein